MCGIVGYIGHRDAYPIIIKGLQRLEYRGYDSAGIVLFDGENTSLSKTKGKVEDLKHKAETSISTTGKLGLGHTRWATHGVPNDVNSHPHYSNSGPTRAPPKRLDFLENPRVQPEFEKWGWPRAARAGLLIEK